MSVLETERSKPAEDLAVIRHLMEQSQGVIHGAASHYLLWSVVITVALVLTWAHARSLLGLDPKWIWTAAIAVGWLGSMWLGYRQHRKRSVNTAAGRVMSSIWIGAGIAMTLLGSVGTITGTLVESAMLAAIASVMGVAFFATGALYEGGWPRLAGMGWWAGAGAMLLWPGVHALLVMAGLTIAFHLVPGVIVYRKNGGTAAVAARSR